MTILHAGIALLTLVLQGPPAQAPAKATIEGTVVRTGSGDPVSGVHVTLTKSAEARTPQTAALDRLRAPAPIPSAITDAQGKFLLKDVEAGAYRIAFAANGYVRQEFGQKLFPGQGTLVNITPGQAMNGLTIRMAPSATVSGRVSDSSKQPVPIVPVYLMRFTYDASGRRSLRPLASSQTDDHGEYRFYYLTPGRYYLAAGTLPEANPVRAVNGAMDTYAVTYYPSSADIGGATAIDIKPGAELNMDVSMRPQALYRIRGKVVDSRMGQAPSSVTVGLTTTSSTGSSSYEVKGDAITYTSADGSFEIRGVLPGAYLMTVTWGDSVQVSNAALAALGLSSPAPTAGPVDAEAARARAQQSSNTFTIIQEGIAYVRINVSNADVENLALTLVPGGPVAGRLRVDTLNGAAASIQNVKVQLKPSLDGLPANIPGVFQPRAGEVTNDGTFSIASVKAGEYRVSVEGLPAGYYVKEARVGAGDVLNRPFAFTPDGTNNNAMEIVLASGAASINGTASNDRQEAISGGQIVLVPEHAKDRLDLYKTATSDARGHFTFSNVAPGDYKVFAWEALEPNAFFDPELLAQVDARGKSIHLTELTSPTVDIRVIPAESAF